MDGADLDSVGQLKLIPANLKEAALDSPSFRTTAAHFADQIEHVERWIESYMRICAKLIADTEGVQETVNQLLSKSFPSFATENILDHDYTLTAMRSYAEGFRLLWANFSRCFKGLQIHIIDPLTELQRKELRQYKDVKRHFDLAQSRYDSALARYAGQNKLKEPSALREDAFQVFEARKQYIKFSLDLCSAMVIIQHSLDRVLITALANEWDLIAHDLPTHGANTDGKFYEVTRELKRVRAWSDAMETSIKMCLRELGISRRDIEILVVAEAAPPRELSAYSPGGNGHVTSDSVAKMPTSPVSPTSPASPVLAAVPTPTNVTQMFDGQQHGVEKYGWLFLRTLLGKPARHFWVRRWFFVKDGLFGWLVQSSSGTYVEESDKVGVLLCNVKLTVSEDRRFCFDITTKDTTILCQAETQQDMVEWIQAFDGAKRRALERSNSIESAQAFSIIPPLPEFALTVQSSPDWEGSHDGVLVNDAARQLANKKASNPPALQALINAGQSIAGHPPSVNYVNNLNKLFEDIVPPITTLAPSVISNCPLSTSMTKHAVMLQNYGELNLGVPNGVTANSWGSVNWASLQKQQEDSEGADDKTAVRTSAPTTVTYKQYPTFYPHELRVQDTQLRILYPHLDNDEFVCLVYRGVWNGQTQQEFSGRIYVTNKNIYMYSLNCGMAFLKSQNLGTITNLRGQTNADHDDLFVLLRGFEMYCKTYLENGRLVHRRLQILIDNYNSPTKLGLADLLAALRDAKPEDVDSSLWFEDHGLLEDESSNVVSSTADRRQLRIDKNLLSGSKQLPERSMTNAHIRQNQRVVIPEKPIEYDLSDQMEKLVFEQDLPISAKAVFHIMFGDKSVIFQTLYAGSGANNMRQSPWMHIDSHRLEREFSFDIQAKSVVNIPFKQEVVVVQQIEHLEDYLCYVVMDRRTPWNLPCAESFYQVNRYVITFVSRSTSRLAVWSGTEWRRQRPVLRALLRGIALDGMESDARIVGQLVTSKVRKMGVRGRTSKAILLYGQVGHSTAPAKVDERGLLKSLQDKDGRRVVFTHRSFGYLMVEKVVTMVEAGILNAIVVLVRSGQQVWSFFNGHWFIISVALVSLLLNGLLSSRASVAFWNERRANEMVSSLGVRPNGVLAKGVYLKDLDEYLSAGVDLAVDPHGRCYNKFRSTAETLVVGSPLEFMEGHYASSTHDSSMTRKMARRVWTQREKLSVQRHQYIVAIRMLNRLEKELLRAEWTNWLDSEHARCTMLRSNRKVLAAAKTAALANGPGDLLDGEGSNRTAADIEALILDYCTSCDTEYRDGRHSLL
ncbi:uncharacterized protein V1510DRAFT_422401 [Dipodascopsis tothii]|uniref:uncharacterized protein n=1 Tax=Dipodascopsis tothii TaxID=44089 RepID=UPI0034CDE596